MLTMISYYLSFKRENFIDGIKTYDFHLPKTTFDFSDPENSGFSKGNIGNGALNISTCYGGINAFVSQPHFLNADKIFLDNVDGLEPNMEKHNSRIHFEPTISTPLAGNIRFQINFFLPRNINFNLVKKVKPVLLPVIWFDEGFELNSNTKEEIQRMLVYIGLASYMYLLLILFGVLICSVVFILNLINLLKKKKSIKIKENKESEADLLKAPAFG
ncbi:unnamed protein product [Brachionus calyciflorus]|uniref:Uncharacterized protein n=1 Tax=Brachionus calyciflorus TaxID=104777 RepID=A0A814HZJ3_9BILA|nr:unnamed protein product [Brachionus calyciflorus]